MVYYSDGQMAIDVKRQAQKPAVKPNPDPKVSSTNADQQLETVETSYQGRFEVLASGKKIAHDLLNADRSQWNGQSEERDLYFHGLMLVLSSRLYLANGKPCQAVMAFRRTMLSELNAKTDDEDKPGGDDDAPETPA